MPGVTKNDTCNGKAIQLVSSGQIGGCAWWEGGKLLYGHFFHMDTNQNLRLESQYNYTIYTVTLDTQLTNNNVL